MLKIIPSLRGLSNNDRSCVAAAQNGCQLQLEGTSESTIWTSLAFQLSTRLTGDTIECIGGAFSFVQETHKGQIRLNGSPFVDHIVDILMTLVVMLNELNPNVLTAAVLHDTVEDSDVTVDEIREMFGAEVAQIVARLTQDGSREAYLRRFHDGTPVSILRIKLADRLSNIAGTHQHFPPQCQYLQETIAYFLPLATQEAYFGSAFTYWLQRAGCT